MAATTKTYRDGNSATFTAREWDDGTAISAVTIMGDGAGGMLAKAEDAAAVSGDPGIVVLGVRRDTPASSSGTDGDYSTFNFDSAGNLYTTGTFAGSVAITAGPTSIAKAEDVASANADVGVPAMAIQKATPADTAGTDGDYAMVQMSGGRLWTTANIDKLGGTVVVSGGVAGSQGVGGTVATNVAITANPINLGAQAVSSENAAVTTARQVQLVADLVGKLIVLPYANPENFVSGAITSAMTGTTSTSLVAAPGAGLRNYITTIIVSNAHATQGTDIIIQDGSGGPTLLTIPAAAVYGGAAITLPTPLRQPTANTALYCANVTTGASTKVSAVGYKGS